MKTYSILEREKGEFKEVGRVVERENKVFLVGFREEAEEFYSNLGFGEKVYTPKDGQRYIDALIEKFMFSSSIAIKLIEVSKGGKPFG